MADAGVTRTLLSEGSAFAGRVLRPSSAARRTAPTSTPAVGNVLGSAELEQGLQAAATSLGRPVDELRREAAEHLREMSASHNPVVLAGWSRLGQWMLRGYDVLVDEEGLARVRALDSRHALAFLISHRSYLDEWVVPPTLPRFGIAMPFGVAGANLDFFPLGPIARRTGIVHIRRATADIPIYKLAMRAFMGQLVADRANLVWSIEGGRSRTGKLRPPRLGLLRYVVDAAEDRDTDEVMLVPVSIVYDQLPAAEVELMTSEARGKGKTPENARWFLGYLRGLDRRLGRIYMDIGEPIALRARLAELRLEDASEAHSVERVALEVSHRINRATPVTPTAAVCVALLAADRALALEEVLQTLEPLADYLGSRDWPIAGGADITDVATVRRALQDLVTSGVLTSFSGGTATVWGIGPEQHLIAGVYRNSAIHVLVLRAIAEVAFVSASDLGSGTYDAWAECLRLRDLLKFEFFFPDRKQFAAELQSELRLIAPDLQTLDVSPSAEDAERHLGSMRLFVAHLVLRPFVDAYAIVAEQLLSLDDGSAFEEKRFVSQCLLLGQQWVLQRRISSAESVSAEMFQTALRLARHRGLVEATAPDVQQRRSDFVDEIRVLQRRVAQVAARAARLVS